MRTVAFALLLFAAAAGPLGRHGAAAGDGWQPLALARFGNVDSIDADDGDLATFLKSIRNDGRFVPPMRNMVGSEIRNPTFFGLTYEAWIECVVAAPPQAGGLETIWVFPVDNRDEYMGQLSNHGLSEYEGMDGVTILREMDADGNVGTWHMEWLPGNVAVFGAHRGAVAAMRQLYAENSAARGMLTVAAGRFVEPDVTVRLYPPRLAAWQDVEPGSYWWRTKISALTQDLIDYWRPNPARARLLRVLSDELVAWPRTLRSVDASVWFEREGVEWRLETTGDFSPAAPRSQLSLLRALPERTAVGYAVPVGRQALTGFGEDAGRLLLSAAGGVVSGEAKGIAASLFALLVAANPRQAVLAWVPPPATQPALGGSRVLLMEWEYAEGLSAAWRLLVEALVDDGALSHALAQIGIAIAVSESATVPGSADIVISPSGGDAREPYYNATHVVRVSGGRMALVGGSGRPDPGIRDQVAEYRAGLAAEMLAAAEAGTPGGPDTRQAFVRMGSRGASIIGFLGPVRFMQFALVEAADWRPRSPDQHEPLSTQLAKEMLEYGSAGAWSMVGEAEAGVWRFDGGMSWQSLARLSAALGITESIGMD